MLRGFIDLETCIYYRLAKIVFLVFLLFYMISLLKMISLVNLYFKQELVLYWITALVFQLLPKEIIELVLVTCVCLFVCFLKFVALVC